jgi:drug/metabolite transporter (DMT)-like permease
MTDQRRGSGQAVERWVAIAALIAAVSIWGGSFVVIKSGLRSLPLFHFLFLRFGLCAVLLVPLAIGSRRQRAAFRHPGPWILGVLLFAGLALQAAGLRTTSPADSAFATSMSVVVVPFLVWVSVRRRPPRRSWSAAILATVGLALIFSGSAGHWRAGDLLSLGCAVAFALYIVVAEQVAAGVPLVGAVAVQSLVCVALSLPWVALESNTTLVPSTHSDVFWAAVYAGIGATAIASGLQLFAQRHLGSIQTAILLSLEPGIATATSLVLGEDRLTTALLLGGCLLLIAAMSVAVAPDGPARRAASPDVPATTPIPGADPAAVAPRP